MQMERNIGSSARRGIAVVGAIALLAMVSVVGVGGVAEASGTWIDATFHSPLGAGDQVNVVVEAFDGSVLVGGSFTVGGTGDLVKLNRDGTIDQEFNASEGVGFDGSVTTIAVEPGGALLVGGFFTHYGATAVGHIAELTPDGHLAATFGTGADAAVRKIISLGYNKFIAVGDFTHFAGVAHGAVVQLDSYVFDPHFSANFDGPVNDITRQANGSFVAVGTFTTANLAPHQRIARITATGATDSSFVASISAPALPLAVAVLSTGRIAVAGQFSTVDGATRNNFVFLNPNGSLATGLAVVPSPTLFVWSLTLLPGDVLLAGGGFTSFLFPGDGLSGAVKVLSNGNARGPFDIGRGPVGYVLTSARLTDGRLLLGGTFTEIGNELTHSLIRLGDVPGVAGSLLAKPGNSSATVSWTAPAGDGGHPIIDYLVRFHNVGYTSQGACTITSAVLTRFGATCSGMKNGVTYTVAVTAKNEIGYGEEATAAVTPRTVPTAPRSPKVTFPSAGKARVVWTVPASNGGAVIQRYDVCRASCTLRSSWRSTGLTAGKPNLFYVVTVTKGTKVTMKIRAVNAAGASPLATLVFTQAK